MHVEDVCACCQRFMDVFHHLSAQFETTDTVYSCRRVQTTGEIFTAMPPGGCFQWFDFSFFLLDEIELTNHL